MAFEGSVTRVGGKDYRINDCRVGGDSIKVIMDTIDQDGVVIHVIE
jgi:hypothetical protein